MAKVLISMADKLLENVDAFAEVECMTRSELIRTALREYMAKAKEANNRAVGSIIHG